MMKHIIDYLFEELSNSKAITLVNFIKNKDEENNIDVINKLYNTYKKISSDGDSETSYFNLIKKLIEEKMIKRNDIKHKTKFQESIFSSCEKYDCYEQIGIIAKQQLKNDEDSFFKIDFKDDENIIINIDSIETYFNNYLEKIKNTKEYSSFDGSKIPSGFWNSLFKKEAAGQPTIGKGEFLLIFITDFPKEKGGDVVINNQTIEVKNLISNEAKLGNNLKGNIDPIFDFINELGKLQSKDEIKSQTLNKNLTKGNTEVYQKIKDIIESIENKDEVVKILKDKLINSFLFDKDNLFKFNNITEEAVKKTVEYLFNLKDKKLELKQFSIEFVKIFTSLYVILYCDSENAKYLCLINNQNNKIEFNFILVNDFDKIINNDKFPFFMIRNSSGVKMILIGYK